MKFLLISTCFHFVRQFHMTNGQTVTQDILPISLSISFFCAFPSSIRGLLNDAGCLMRQRKQLKQHNNNKRNSLPLKIIHPSCQIPPLSIPLFLKRGGRSLEKEQLCTRNALLIRITLGTCLCAIWNNPTVKEPDNMKRLVIMPSNTT